MRVILATYIALSMPVFQPWIRSVHTYNAGYIDASMHAYTGKIEATIDAYNTGSIG
jgi:ABC-type cobalt transport system substrate-binding protein